jgi:hypothetical protein
VPPRSAFRLRYTAYGLLVVIALWVLFELPFVLAFTRGVQAYLFGYPLVTMDLTERVMTSPQALTSGHGHRPGAGPVNQFANVTAFPGPAMHDVVAPNVDTLYSVAWLDLSSGPLVLSMPDMHGRWVLMEVLDAWTNAFASLGTRVYGDGARRYLITGPGWKGTVPSGMVRVSSPTNLAWIIGRTYTNGVADIPAVSALQKQYRLTPLATVPQPQSEADAALHPTAGATHGAIAAVDVDTPEVTQVSRLDAREFFARLPMLMVANPPAPADTPMLRTLAKLGIVPGRPFHWSQLDASTRRGMTDAVWFVRQLFEARAPGTQAQTSVNGPERVLFGTMTAVMNKALLNVHHYWIVPLNIGSYGTHYARRAIVTLVGLGANIARDGAYMLTEKDANGRLLSGRHVYRLHFGPGQLPPSEAFWSLTLYNEKGFLAANPLDRYALGDRSGLRRNQDGSLDLWIGHQAPDGRLLSNWLPAPAGRFRLILRVFDPRAALLQGHWVPPGVDRLADGYPRGHDR